MDESPVGRCNQLIKRYNDLSAAITTEVNAKITEAIAKYDADASRIIQTYAASANKIQKKSINYNINFSTSHLKLFKISFFIISIVFLTLSLLNPKG